MEESYTTKNKAETIELGKNIIQLCLSMDLRLIILIGEYGSGKTTFVKGIAKGLNIKDTIKSPSFNKKFQYKNLIHYDLYNVKSSELDFYKNQILEDLEFNNVIIEWGENILVKKYRKAFSRYLEIRILTLNENERKFYLKLIKR